MRLFVALTPPAAVVDAVLGAREPGLRHTPDLHWTRPDGWHLTLAFLGEVPDDLLPGLTGALGAAVGEHDPFDLTVDGWGVFPHPHRDRAAVLWAGVGGDTGALAALSADLRAAASAAGLPGEDRIYVPHLTVARSRPPRDLTGLLSELGNGPQAPWPARDVHLVESRPGREDRYRTARTWALGWKTDPGRPPERSTA
ncbi:RNA 2',3'-cyclic phosphodiesterase [Nocardiopsis changdeensis]|uniref:RNA 2',3'-cyclic phosphodiesterase n=1 Tax=Nocardiopsis changdeensis TaxID=2831969 RepID=A0ABX8BMM8_9ACTN|nr:MULTISPECIES: RNA 2',3'-cyclic phosphodiesterase [Nocardiopsis]QUX23495.1 RNA 2',3'-cyclic phosphodiesterase [Nocardiopsis changdeensis]QYX39439.1 RNA 2',3'-cyclic phosphodiesterase [Nocardiopsis sp. MT53]